MKKLFKKILVVWVTFSYISFDDASDTPLSIGAAIEVCNTPHKINAKTKYENIFLSIEV